MNWTLSPSEMPQNRFFPFAARADRAARLLSSTGTFTVQLCQGEVFFSYGRRRKRKQKKQ